MANNFSRGTTACVMEISNELDERKLAELICICKMRKCETFSQRHAEECKDFSSLFLKLSELDIIQCGNITFVEEILEDIGRVDLSRKIKNSSANADATQTDGRSRDEANNQQQDTQGTNGAQASPGVQNSNNLIVVGNNNKVMKDCVVNIQY